MLLPSLLSKEVKFPIFHGSVSVNQINTCFFLLLFGVRAQLSLILALCSRYRSVSLSSCFFDLVLLISCSSLIGINQTITERKAKERRTKEIGRLARGRRSSPWLYVSVLLAVSSASCHGRTLSEGSYLIHPRDFALFAVQICSCDIPLLAESSICPVRSPSTNSSFYYLSQDFELPILVYCVEVL